jgi:hypothetical protein
MDEYPLAYDDWGSPLGNFSKSHDLAWKEE